MKRVIGIIFAFIIICFLIPIIFAEKPKKEVAKIENANDIGESSKEYDYKEYNTINLLHTETGQVEQLKLDEYLYGVVSAEMPASFHDEALKAQAVVARTYTIYKITKDKKHESADICDSPSCCQAWISKENRLEKWEENSRETNWNKIVSAVETTKGEVIKYEGEVINALFHSNSGGTTEIASNVWGGSDYPYLQSVATSGENNYSQYSSEVRVTKDELIEKLKGNYPEIVINLENVDEIKILEYTEAGRVKTVKFGNTNISGVEVRSLIGLKSTNFLITIENNNITFTVVGYGHGVGMSQTGADSLAKEGKTYKEIIYHYYTGVEIEKLAST